jgi:hypothetical protein
MSRRSSGFVRMERDFYPTPAETAAHLLPWLAPRTVFIEPCAGDLTLVDMLEAAGHRCVRAIDVMPRGRDLWRMEKADGASVGAGPEVLITNPPFAKGMLLPLLDAWLAAERRVWLLLPISVLCNLYFARYCPYIWRVVPAGRPKWIPDSKWSAKDDVAWVSFRPVVNGVFAGRRAVTGGKTNV